MKCNSLRWCPGVVIHLMQGQIPWLAAMKQRDHLQWGGWRVCILKYPQPTLHMCYCVFAGTMGIYTHELLKSHGSSCLYVKTSEQRCASCTYIIGLKWCGEDGNLALGFCYSWLETNFLLFYFSKHAHKKKIPISTNDLLAKQPGTVGIGRWRFLFRVCMLLWTFFLIFPWNPMLMKRNISKDWLVLLEWELLNN